MKVTVTGAASGIGKATVLELLDMGAEVLAVDLPNSNLDYLVGSKGEKLFADVADQDSRNMIIDKSVGFDGLVNAAGKIETKKLMDYSISDLRELFMVNFESAWDLTSKIGATMPTGGSIVNISSAGAKIVTNSNVGPYSATKAAILSMTRTFSYEFAPRGIRVNAICPGLIETPMQDKVNNDLALSQGISLQEIVGKRVELIPMKRFGTSAECARIIIFLLSENSSYITGQSLNVTGGWVTH